MEKYFLLTVKKGTVRIQHNSSIEIKGVPDNAFDLICEGCTWLILSNESVEFLKDQPREKLEALLKLREKQGYKSDVLIIRKALKSAKEPKTSVTK
jgi:hypothetical protein